MADVLTGWRQALITALSTQFPTAEVMSGPRTGVSRDKVRINVFASSDPQGHLGDRVSVATPRMVVRYWPPRSEQPPSDTDFTGEDTTPLEEAKNAVETFLKTKQTSLAVTNLWYFRVESARIDPDPEEWGVEFLLQGFGLNVAETLA